MDIVRVEVFDAVGGYQTHRLTVKDMALLLGYPDTGRMVRMVRGMHVIDGGRIADRPLPKSCPPKHGGRHHLKLLAGAAKENETASSPNALAS